MAPAQFRPLYALALGALVACGSDGPAAPDTPRAKPAGAPLMVFAAMSLQDALGEAARAYGDQRGELRTNFAGTHVLVQQIEAGAKADVFVSANEDWLAHLTRSGHLRSESRRALPVRYLSIGDPGAVPAGRYARDYLKSIQLENATLWTTFADRVAPAPDVRAALTAVEGRADVLGIVYNTDAIHSKRVRVIWTPTAGSAPTVEYYAAVTASSAQPEKALAFLDWLGQSEARAIFSRHGFLPPSP